MPAEPSRPSRQSRESTPGGDRCRGVERRRSPRRLALDYRVWVGWWQPGGFVVTAARVGNVSRGGALVVLLDPPPEGHPVWLCAEGSPAGAVRGTVLQVTPRRGTAPAREYAARVEFAAPCPDRFLAAVAYGVP